MVARSAQAILLRTHESRPEDELLGSTQPLTLSSEQMGLSCASRCPAYVLRRVQSEDPLTAGFPAPIAHHRRQPRLRVPGRSGWRSDRHWQTRSRPGRVRPDRYGPSRRPWAPTSPGCMQHPTPPDDQREADERCDVLPGGLVAGRDDSSVAHLMGGFSARCSE